MMGQVTSEGLDYIGRIDDNGYVFDKSNTCIAKIDESGYILSLSKLESYGKIDEDGTIRNSALDVVGNIQANGYVYIHSKRICHVDSPFIRSITPRAWNYGQAGIYPNEKKPKSNDDASSNNRSTFSIGFLVKLFIGVVMGVYCIIEAGYELGIVGCLLAIPFCVVVVFGLSIMFRFINYIFR